MKKILSTLVLLSLVLPILSSAKADDRLGNREDRIENRIKSASTTVKRLENREDNINRIRARIASTTASTTSTSTVKRLEKLDDRLEKQVEQMAKVKDRLLEKELKVIDVLGKIASKIQERITILETKGLNLTSAKAKLAEAATKIEEMTVESNNLATLLDTTASSTDQTTLFQNIRATQDKIKVLAKATHALLVDTIKEINKVLPKNGRSTSTATTTATTTI